MLESLCVVVYVLARREGENRDRSRDRQMKMEPETQRRIALKVGYPGKPAQRR